jgi:hypothetical protein
MVGASEARLFGYRRLAMMKWRISGPHILSLATFSYQAGNRKTQKENGWFQTLRLLMFYPTSADDPT